MKSKRASEREREKMKTKDNCFLCMYVDDIECSSRLTYSNPSSIHIQQQWFLFFSLLFANAHTQTFDRYSITSCICEYTQPCAHCCNFLLRAAVVVSQTRGMNEIELVIRITRRTNVKLNRCSRANITFN